MFAAQRHRKFSIRQHRQLRGVQLPQHFFQRPFLGIDRRQRGDPEFLVALHLQFFVVQLHIPARRDNRCRTVARTMLVAGGPLQRYRQNYRARFLVVRIFFRQTAKIVRSCRYYRSFGPCRNSKGGFILRLASSFNPRVTSVRLYYSLACNITIRAQCRRELREPPLHYLRGR